VHDRTGEDAGGPLAEDTAAGHAYAIWTGIGTLGTAVLGIALFGEEASAARLACIGLIVAGIGGLKLISPS
jgi:quaternary ammonium compound-resistance protein SugE